MPLHPDIRLELKRLRSYSERGINSMNTKPFTLIVMEQTNSVMEAFFCHAKQVFSKSCRYVRKGHLTAFPFKLIPVMMTIYRDAEHYRS